ncbi:cation diffusion facilitator family transporter [Falsiroseomonas sp. HC035]|uniref:cation diffusion facilitator family transporter n=1 Tax=Falsiroseomonas sp. HC035 TaxID=3390999 RepID=UPI003D316553
MHAHGHAEQSKNPGGKGKRLLGALALNVGITVAQIVGGLMSGSLSLLADAAHNASDAASLGISYAAWRISKRKPDRRRTFGYARAETVGALINLTTLFVIAIYLAYEAVSRLLDPPQVGGWTMVIVGAIAFVEDAISAWLLWKDRGSLNIKSAFLHMFADTLATVGVIVGGVLILLYDIAWVDPLITAAISVYIFIHAWHEIRKAIAVLMESAPKDFDYERLEAELRGMEGVKDVHHLHVWQPDEERIAVEAHVAVTESDLAAADALRRRIQQRLRESFGVEHATLQLEPADAIRHDRSLVGQG